MTLDEYRRCTDCCLNHHDRCDGNAYIWHVGADHAEVVPCECAECKAPEPNDIAPPLSWDPEDPGWAPTPAYGWS